jgi:hypothetical protein
MIYVDEMVPCLRNRNWPYGHSCHLFADTLEELHRFAVAIGLRRDWFQNHPKLPHYDLTFGKRKQAVAKGAIPVDRKKTVEMMERNKQT